MLSTFSHFSSLLNLLVQTIYTSEFFYLAVLVGAKVSVAMLIRNVIPVELHTKVADIFSVVVFAWGVSCEFAAAFICGGLSTWREQLIDDSRATQVWEFSLRCMRCALSTPS